MDNNRSLRRLIGPPVFVIALLFIVWEAAVDLGNVPSWQLPSPSAILHEGVAVWPRLMDHTAATLTLTAIGFAGGAAAGFVLAALLHLLPGARRAVYPLLVLSQNVPVVALGPLLTLWLGYGLLPKLVLVWLVCFFPVSVSMLSGLTDTDPTLRNYMQMIGASKSQLFWRMELPNAVTHLFSGLKIAASYAVLSAVVAEWIGSQKGLGHFMLLSSKGYEADRVFAAVFLIVALSLTMFGLVAGAEKLIVRWRPAEERGGA
ncbi:ABC transporter permease [Paenibacillus sp. NEAU-GSW1]|uniref:ABC transporter permease n=1 Tax=Paenibacillus sp. NEAU-GSW1 TaxID=2682486 RepID=UPI0012E0DCD1|nr:ABC transporter permease [Paenibacillus sp. NEAU-GSW1]MUT66298.1 ABC transporter permease subunit [Paenibacillus sp. NEAU-GSW1]